MFGTNTNFFRFPSLFPTSEQQKLGSEWVQNIAQPVASTQCNKYVCKCARVLLNAVLCRRNRIVISSVDDIVDIYSSFPTIFQFIYRKWTVVLRHRISFLAPASTHIRAFDPLRRTDNLTIILWSNYHNGKSIKPFCRRLSSIAVLKINYLLLVLVVQLLLSAFTDADAIVCIQQTAFSCASKLL